MRICHVCSGHGADDTRVFHHECVSLAAAGYEVHLLAIAEAQQCYQRHGVIIHPLPPPRGRRERLARRGQVARMAARLKPDLFHVHEPELLGPTLARAGGRPVVWDVHESYLDVLMDRDWIPRPLRSALRLAWDVRERQLVRRCAGVVATSARIAERYRPMRCRLVRVENYPPLSALESEPIAARDGRTCVFAGVLSSDRGLTQVIAALGILKERGLEVKLALAGRPEPRDYLDALLQDAQRLGIRGQVSYHGVLTKAEATTLQMGCSIGLVPDLPLGNRLVCTPIKLVEFMGYGLPMVHSDFPNHRDLIGTARVGVAVDPMKPVEIADAIEYLVTHPDVARQMGEEGRRRVRERMNWEYEEATLLQLYSEILTERPLLSQEPGARSQELPRCVSG